jgi:hypothetical protein
MWLDRIQLTPKAHSAWVEKPEMRVDGLQWAMAKQQVERQARRMALDRMRQFAADELSTVLAAAHLH